jgi:hypothetical protein
VILGENKSALKEYKKNILPPFDDEGWTTNTGFEPVDLFREGYNMSFTAPQYQGVNIYLPNSLAGNVFSLSCEYAEGISPWLEIIYRQAGSGNLVYRGVNCKNSKIENYSIPKGATDIRVKLSSTTVGTDFVLFKNVQLEVGTESTKFEEMQLLNSTAKKGLRFNGSGVLNIDNMTGFLSYERDFSMEATITPQKTSLQSNEAMVFGWAGWHNGLIYNAVEQQLRVHIHYKTKATGSYNRAIIPVSLPFGKRVTATMTYRASNREISLYFDGVLKARLSNHSFSDKSVYDFNTYVTGLSMGAIYNGTYKFVGTIERGKIWSKTLSEDEVAKGTRVGLVLDYDLTNQDVSSSKAVDLVSQNNATISQGAGYLQKDSVKKASFNYAPPLKDWTYTGGARYENGIAVMPSYSARITSPLIRVDGEVSTLRISGQYLATSPAPTSMANNSDGSHFAIYGTARISAGEIGKWSDRSVSSDSHTYTLGHLVKYIQVDYKLSSQFTQDNIKIKDVMLTDVNGDDGFEVYKDQVLVNKSAKGSLKKSYESYPFEFVRKGVIDFDGKLVGANQPRINQDGIRVEEATKNMFNPSFNNADVEAIVEDGEKVYVLDSTNNSSYEDFQTSRAYNVDSSKTYTISFLAKWNRRLAWELRGFDSSSVRLNDPKMTWVKDPEPNPNEYQRYEATITLTSGTTACEFLRCYYLPSDVGVAHLKEVQIEERYYRTSYAENERKKENVAIVNAGQYIDTQRGSIELEFTPLVGDNVIASDNWGFSDLSSYVANTGGFLLRRSYGKANRIELVVVSSVSGINVMGYADTVGWKVGDTLKYRLEWDATANTTTLIVNGSYVVTVPSCFKMFPDQYRYSLNVGSRGMVNDSYGCGNAVYKSLVIRNRNGETTYKL